jgi:hypothetical protein
MSARSRRNGIIAAGVTAIVACAATAGGYVAISSGDSQPAGNGARVAAVTPGPGRLLRAYGFDAQNAVPVFTLANGQNVGLLIDAEAKCLLRTLNGRIAGETCGTDAAIPTGEAITVNDECGSAGNDLMEIIGLAPENASAVRLLISDGSSKTAPTEEGAFKFDGRNPASGQPYPTGVEWVGSDGAGVGTAPLPVSGDDFCPPAQ